MFLLQKFAIVKYNVCFVAKICKHALRASIEGYLAVAASTPTYSSLGGKEKNCYGAPGALSTAPLSNLSWC